MRARDGETARVIYIFGYLFDATDNLPITQESDTSAASKGEYSLEWQPRAGGPCAEPPEKETLILFEGIWKLEAMRTYRILQPAGRFYIPRVER